MAKAFSLVELLATIGIIAFLSALTIPTISKMQEKGKATKCMSNLKQLAATSLNYASDHDGRLPGNDNNTIWFNNIWRYAYPDRDEPSVPPTPGVFPEGWKGTIFECPNTLKTDPATSAYRSYGFNLRAGNGSTGTLDNIGAIAFPARTAMLGDNKASNDLKYDNITARHSGRCNVAYMDGHVSTITITDALKNDRNYKLSFWGNNTYADNWATEQAWQ